MGFGVGQGKKDGGGEGGQVRRQGWRRLRQLQRTPAEEKKCFLSRGSKVHTHIKKKKTTTNQLVRVQLIQIHAGLHS